MSSCKKDTNIPLLDGGGLLVKNIKFSTDRKEVNVYQTGDLQTVCTNDIDLSTFLGVKIVGSNLVFTDAISGLNTNLSSDVSNNPVVRIILVGGVLSIIGVDDVSIGFSVPQMNVRYDSATNSVKFQI